MEEKKSWFSRFFKLTVVIGTIMSVIMAISKWVAGKTEELEEENEDRTQKNYLFVMNGQSICLDQEAVEEINIRSYLGGVNLDLSKALLAQETDIDIYGLMSGIVIKVPPMVRVILNGTNILSGFANMVPNYETEDLPTVYVTAECIMSGVSVQMVPEVEQ